MQIIKSKQIESVAIEIIDKTHKNTIVICIYKHPNLSVADFNEDYLQHLLDKLSYERKNIILLGDFNIDLLHYETDYQTRNFLDKMYSNSLAPKITIPTRLTTHSKILIDNIFDTNTVLFLIYINDLNEAIEHSIIHQFADNRNILYSNKSLKNVNPYINH